MEILLSVLIGLGLAAACGFRIFVPFLVVSIASASGHLDLAPGFEWIGTTPALIAFAVATALEIAAYYIPWLDNLLDTIATPAAVVAGAIVAASVVQDVSPFLRWSLAVIVGGGIAGTIQVATATVRGGSAMTTGGIANPAVSTGELGGSVVTSVLAVVVPVLAAALVVVLLVFIVRNFRRVRLFRRGARGDEPHG